LSNGFPRERPTCPANEKAGHATIFEEFEGNTVFNSVAVLAAPAGVTERSEAGTITRSGWGDGVGVGLFVVVVRKMVECLKSIAGVRVKGYSIICRAVQIF
jgi:hypothetical protein